jgi:hypothetical protein
LNPTFPIECAVWHPDVAADTIARAVGLTPLVGWSAGDTGRRPAGRAEDRTYCRFGLGDFTQEQIFEGMQMLRPFLALFEIPSFDDGRGAVAVYFRGVADAAELILNVPALEMIHRLKASVVLW